MSPDSASGASPQHPAYRFSGIARPVDPAYPTNKALLVLLLVVTVGGALLRWLGGDAGLGAAVLAGLSLAGACFLAWALTRELSPDDNPAAFIAAALVLAVWVQVGDQSLLVAGGVLLAVRIVNRCTGKAAEFSDGFLVAFGLAALAYFTTWSLGLVGAAALALDARLAAPGDQARRKHHLVLALVPAAATLARLYEGVAPIELPAHLPVFGAIAGLCLIAALAYPEPKSCGDVDQRRLSHARVRAGLLLGLAATIGVSVDSGFELQSASTLWACMLAVPIGLPVAVWRGRPVC